VLVVTMQSLLLHTSPLEALGCRKRRGGRRVPLDWMWFAIVHVTLTSSAAA